MCCPKGKGGVGWVGRCEVGEVGDVVYHWGRKGVDCSCSSNYCHTLSMRNIERESERL